MKEKPILFSTPMIRAILENRKTMTRRVVRPRAHASIFTTGMDDDCILLPGYKDWVMRDCPYNGPGDRLWVRETWADEHPFDGQILYRERDEYRAPERWRPSIFMPRKYSRILLEVVSVRVERLQEISEEDAREEGIIDGGCLSCGGSEPCGCSNPKPDARDAFINLWDSINAKRGVGWDVNPWVWVVEFKRI